MANKIKLGIENINKIFDKTKTGHKRDTRIHRKTVYNKYNQAIIWWLGRHLMKNDYLCINSFFRKKNAILIRSNPLKIHYRIFDGDLPSLHIIISKKNYGIAVNTHYDVTIHDEVDFTKSSLRILSELYVKLKGLYGKVLMVPREDGKFQGLLCRNTPKQNNIKKVKRYKYRPRF